MKETLYPRLQTLSGKQFKKYLEEEKNGYIRIKSHSEDENIIILNYTDLTVYEKRWNNETMKARGLILDKTNYKDDDSIIYILAKPFEKFFNYGENLNYEEGIDFSQKPIVMEKMDGSLGISYFFKEEIRFATRGSFTSNQAEKATKMWRENYSKKFNLNKYLLFPYTILTEIIYPENRIVVDYGEDEKLVLLGIRNIVKDEIFLDETPYDSLKKVSNQWGMQLAQQYNLTIDKMLDMKKTITANEEGWIVKFSCDKRLKIKGDEYMNVHRITHGLSEKAKFYAFAEDSLNHLILQMPEEFRKEIEQFESNLNLLKLNLLNQLNNYFKQLKTINDRKEFALRVIEVVPSDLKSIIFHAKNHNNNVISEDLIRKHIYNNYREYSEVIKNWNKCKE